MHWCESSPHCCWLDKKFGFKYSYANFLCMKESSMNVNLALLSVYVVWNGSSPPGKQMAAQWHGGEWRRKKNKKAEEIWVGNWWSLETEALGKQSLVFEAKAWKSREFVLQHSPGAGTAQEHFPSAPTLTWHTLSCSLSPSTPACPRAGHRAVPHPGLTQALQPCQDTTAGKGPFSSTAKHAGAGLGSSGKRVWMHPKKPSWFPLPLCCGSNRGSCTQVWTKL